MPLRFSVQRRFARRAEQPTGWPTVLQLSQKIMPSEYLGQKTRWSMRGNIFRSGALSGRQMRRMVF
jgi:hypothetical protein